MTIMVDTQRALTGGVDTHADVHVARVLPGGRSTCLLLPIDSTEEEN